MYIKYSQLCDWFMRVQDFFGQLRASGSADFGKYCMEGLSTGLQASSVALQVLRCCCGLSACLVALSLCRPSHDCLLAFSLVIVPQTLGFRCVLQMRCTCFWGLRRQTRAQKYSACLRCGGIRSCHWVLPSMQRSCTWRRMCGSPVGLVIHQHGLSRFL